MEIHDDEWRRTAKWSEIGNHNKRKKKHSERKWVTDAAVRDGGKRKASGDGGKAEIRTKKSARFSNKVTLIR